VRGVAALTVLVSHAANTGWLPSFLGHGNGKMAVGLFFILSGFLMTWLYANKAMTFIPNYAMHRFARVVPLYITLVCLSIIFPWAVFPIDSTREIVEHLGFLFGIETLWTIPVEIQFYFLFVTIWIWRWRVFPILIVLQAAFATAFYFAHIPALTLPFWLHFFLIGSGFGFAFRRYGEKLSTTCEPYGRWGWAILLFAVVATPGLRSAAGLPVLPIIVDPLGIAALILLFGGALLGLGPLNAFATSVPRWLGKISYGVYLIHFPVLKAVGGLDLAGPVLFLLGLVGTLLLATLSFHLFEEPLRRWLTAHTSEPAPAGIVITPSAP
jgi:peptidoglycan/LPS O-acetylase OafA/YrhL